MFKKIALIVVALLILLVGGFFAAAAMQPDDFRVSRSMTMAAAPADVHAQVNDFHKWDHWSPWAKIDPNCKFTFEGPASGVGAVFAWDGNDEVGAGRMTITDSKPGELVRIKLEFFKPFPAENAAEFTFVPAGDRQTNVSWTMTGTNNLIGKVFCLVMNMDEMVGDQFTKGLTTMKSIVEKPAGR